MKKKKCEICKLMTDEEKMLWSVDEQKAICIRCYKSEWKQGILRRTMPLRVEVLNVFRKEEEDEKMLAKLLLDEKFLWAAEALIRAAKKEVYVIAYLMSAPNERSPGKEARLYKELLEAQKRGVDCRVIINYTHPANKIVKQNVLAGRWMGCNGIECRFVARNRTVHAKMMVIDGVTLIVGSHNWTQRAMERNVEASVELKELGIVKEAREYFLDLWKGAVSMARIH